MLLFFQQKLRSRRRKDGWAQGGAAPRLGVEVLNSPPLIVSLKQRCEKKGAGSIRVGFFPIWRMGARSGRSSRILRPRNFRDIEAPPKQYHTICAKFGPIYPVVHGSGHADATSVPRSLAPCNRLSPTPLDTRVLILGAAVAELRSVVAALASGSSAPGFAITFGGGRFVSDRAKNRSETASDLAQTRSETRAGDNL